MRHLPILIMLCSAAMPLRAQWTTAFGVARQASAGHARDPDGTSLLPYGAKVAVLAVRRAHGAWRMEVSARHTRGGIAVSGREAVLFTPGLLSAWGGSVELHLRLAGNGEGPSLGAGIGIEAAHWQFSGAPDDARWRHAALGSLEGTAAIHPRWRMNVRVEGAIGPSLFSQAELPEGYVRKAGMRHGVAFGIERRW